MDTQAPSQSVVQPCSSRHAGAGRAPEPSVLAAGKGAGSSRRQPAALQGLLAGIPGHPDPWVSSVTHGIMATARMGYVFPRGGREPWEAAGRRDRAAGRQGQGSRQEQAAAGVPEHSPD